MNDSEPRELELTPDLMKYVHDVAIHEAEVRNTPPKDFSVSQAPKNNGRDPRLPSPGTTLVRKYKGQMIQVEVTENDFVWEGERYQSLSAVARVITGSHTNGFRFFHLEAK